MAASATRSITQSSTLTKVVYVTRKVQADFLEILDTYGYFGEAYAQKIIADIRLFLDEEVIGSVHFIWRKNNSNYVLEELKYTVIAGGIGLADDRPGGITYRVDLQSADFEVRVRYNDRWRNMPEVEKQAVRNRLVLNWGPGGRLDYTGGTWTTDKTYSQDGSDGLVRARFTRS